MVTAGLSPQFIMYAAFISYFPAIVYSILVRYSEKYDREPWGSIGVAFLWGATISIIIVTIVRGWYITEIPTYYPDIASDPAQNILYGDCLLIPFVSVLVNTAGAYWVYEDMEEAEDGLIYGTVIGLGFASTKNLIYAISVGPLFSQEELFTRIMISSITLLLSNAAVTAIAVYGISRVSAKKHTQRHSPLSAIVFIFIAFVMSSFFYIVAYFGKYILPSEYSTGILKSSMTLTLAVIYSIISILLIYTKIWRLDRQDEKIMEEKKRKREMRSLRKAPPPPPQSRVRKARMDARQTPEKEVVMEVSRVEEEEVEEEEEKEEEWAPVEEDDDDWMDF